jgi:hypothetical protein
MDVDNDEQFDYEDDLLLSSWIALNKCFELPFTENPCEDDIVNSVLSANFKLAMQTAVVAQIFAILLQRNLQPNFKFKLPGEAVQLQICSRSRDNCH